MVCTRSYSPICRYLGHKLIYVEKRFLEVKYNSAYVQLKTKTWTYELRKSLQYTSNSEAVFFYA